MALVVLRPDAPKLDPATEAKVQDAHLAYLALLHDEGRLLAAGPLLSGSQGTIRGLTIFRGSETELRSCVEADPWVRAGYLEYQFFPWMVPSGAVHFSHIKFPRSSAEAESRD